MATIRRIKQFILRQRQIGENQFGYMMRKRYDKTASEFYSQFADKVLCKRKDGQTVGLDIQTLWYFRTNDMIKDERGHIIDLKSGNCNLVDVTQQRELLINFLTFYQGDENSKLPEGISEIVDIFLKN